MRILIIQPPDLEKEFQAISHHMHRVIPFGPQWDILCLRQYFENRTRHIVDYLDARLFTSVEAQLTSALSDFEDLQLVVIHCSSEDIGCSAGMIELIKRHQPQLKNVLVGSFPTSFPNHALEIPAVDFVIAGDAERPLQLLADNLDVPTRWQHIPGLAFQGHPTEKPYLREHSKRRVLPDFRGTFWGAYKRGPADSGTRISACLSQGHTGLPCDRAVGPAGQPLRFEDLDQMATCIQRGSHVEIECIHFEDPPGIWSPGFLRAWTQALIRVRNGQPWSFSMLPAYLDRDLCERLKTSGCREIIFQLPSTQPEELEKYGCVIGPRAFRLCLEELRSARILPVIHFFAGGPGQTEREDQQILEWLKALDYPAYSITPFPMAVDAPVYLESFTPEERIHLGERLRWARAPWLEVKPLPIWCGKEGHEHLQQVIRQVHRRDQGGLRRKIRRAAQRALGADNIKNLEGWASGLLSGSRVKTNS